MSLIKLSNINYTYPSGIKALNNVSLTINKGDKVVLMGANGSGKSSLFLLLAGVIKPEQGTYHINGETFRYCRKKCNKLCEVIGYVFQDPDVQVVSTHVDEDVAFGLRNMGLKEAVVQERIDEYLELTGIDHLKRKTIHNLSYGQKKQVALAGVLAMEPQIIMLDEPFAWLDYQQSQRLKAILQRLVDAGKTLIVSTHCSDFANDWADKVLVMKGGELAADTSTHELFTNDRLVDELGIAPLRKVLID